MKSLKTLGRLTVAFCGVIFGLASVCLLPQIALTLFQHQYPGVTPPEASNDESLIVIACSLPLYYVLGAAVGAAVPLVLLGKVRVAGQFLGWTGIIATLGLLILFALHVYPPLGRHGDGSVAPVNYGAPAFLLALACVFAGVVLQLATGNSFAPGGADATKEPAVVVTAPPVPEGVKPEEAKETDNQ